MGLNDVGLLVYRLSFTDGTSGIFTSHVPVPEPASIVLLATGAGLFFRRQARRRQMRNQSACRNH
jgi:hypothetical protein